MKKRICSVLALSFIGSFSLLQPVSSPVYGQENHSLFIRNTEDSVVHLQSEQMVSSEQPASLRISSIQPPDINTDVEIIRERFKNGAVHIERQVSLDVDDNFTNNGSYQEWNERGELIATGRFSNGLMQGPWVKLLPTKGVPLLSTYPYSKFKGPFQSTVNFDGGRMNGVWTISDSENRVVSQIALVDGNREGQSNWFHHNGTVLYQANFSNGTLHGSYIERASDGKLVQDLNYQQGQRSEVIRQFYPSKAIRNEIVHLSALQSVVTSDDWSATQLAKLDSTGDSVPHGSFVHYFENGQVNVRGTHDRGQLVGQYESWHANGERSATGMYQQGKEEGKWVWWHPNGMRRAAASYSSGTADGPLLTWNEQGKRISEEIALHPTTGKGRMQAKTLPSSTHR
jgi:antitoxin component YwqK of YwqJK toxin-antitoxin module